jgi:hypothetical protein
MRCGQNQFSFHSDEAAGAGSIFHHSLPPPITNVPASLWGRAKMKIRLLTLSTMIAVLSALVALNPFGHDLVDTQTTASVNHR